MSSKESIRGHELRISRLEDQFGALAKVLSASLESEVPKSVEPALSSERSGSNNDEYQIIKQLNKEIESLKQEKVNLEASKERIKKECDAFKKKNKKQLQEIKDLKSELQHIDDSKLDDQNEFEELALFINRIPKSIKTPIKQYYAIDSLPIFITQCGQLDRLKQFWGAVIRLVLENSKHTDSFSEILVLITDRYNAATSNNPVKYIMPKKGAPFDFNQHQRFSSDGKLVEEQVLPGISTKAGKVIHKSLVRLK